MKNNPLNFGYHRLKVYTGGPLGKPGGGPGSSFMASVDFDDDVSVLFPYINAVGEKAELHENPGLIRFSFKGSICVLHPRYCLITPIKDREHARAFVDDLVFYLKDIHGRKDAIKPKHKVFQRVSVVDILKILPQTNCRECGFNSCMAFAASLSQQQTVPGRCSFMGMPVVEQVTFPVYDNDGNLQSTVTLDVDMAESNSDLKHKSEYILQLEKKISSLSENRNQDGVQANASLPSPLTDREIEVLCLVAEGATNVEISQLLSISSHTVKSHVINIFNKLTVNDRTQAAVWAAKHKFV